MSLSAYEEARLARIAENNAMLVALGIETVSEQLQKQQKAKMAAAGGGGGGGGGNRNQPPPLTDEQRAAGAERLRADLDSGAWDERYGHLRSQDAFDAGYRIAIAGEHA